MKSSSATHFCKACFAPIKDVSVSEVLGQKRYLCNSCLRKMNPRFEKFYKKGIECMNVYSYNEKIRNLLFLFKGCKDIELAPVFLSEQAPTLHALFSKYYLVNAPSFLAREEKRGFSHVKEMFKVLKLPFIDCLEKTKDVKQADLNYEKRKEIKKHITIKKEAKVAGKRILFVDDVFTSGSTAMAAVSLLKKAGAKKVKVLVMARTRLS